jgi:hypothetical protein
MVWGALAFLLVAAGGSGTVAAVRALRAWHTLRCAGAAASTAAGALAARVETTAERARAAAGGGDRLGAAALRLQASLAELAVIRAAAAEPRSLLRTARRRVR